MYDQPLWRFLEGVADTTIIGVLTTIACLPLVSAPAAVGAASAVLRDDGVSGTLLARYLAALRPRLKVGTQFGLFVAPLLVVAGIDVLWALSEPLTVLRTAVLAAGILVALAASGVLATATADLASRGGHVPCRAVLRRAALQAAAAPHRALLVPFLAAVGAPVVLFVPLLLPVVLGVLSRALPRPGVVDTLPRRPQPMRPALR